jgi:NAD(P)-dependent dehydrogenase (short-subunit alcohol dehydrogenase family)
MSLPFKGKVALVTGSSRGIGKAIALQLADDGADVVVCARSEASTEDLPGSIGETAAAIRAKGHRVLAVKMDIRREDEIRRAVERALQELGRIDILVNNAGIIASPPFMEASPATLDEFYYTNIRGPYVLTQLVAPVMVANGGGAIVNISSGSARNPAPPVLDQLANRPRASSIPYGMSKAALDRFGAGIANELADRNIAVFQIYPGFTITERNSRTNPRPEAVATAERPETTAKAVAFLLRDPMSHTGQIFTSREVVEQNNL